MVTIAATMLATSVVATLPTDAQAATSSLSASTLNSFSITSPQLLNLTKDGFSGKYGSDITSVKLLAEGRVVSVATLSNGTYSFSGLLSGKKIRSTDFVSVIGYNAQGSELHEIVLDITE
ncbi:hypothetical protein PGRAN_15717 [Listeria grandensis FSL F6-0971]|uniref:Bacterial Ig domain-containing protein n=1 Tax=Listeria grandensis FSL F6-0971 TaxID=1265819 RepID=W7AZ60_9LIST|nr:immunoglobulin-like domain-containing protein [Listeria grandensis]EUJ18525.1 hypothetical protein PGRAN_15717 [Listeria grandensis FSL F6-0971]